MAYLPFLAPAASLLDYELLDSGNYRKLERFGSVVLDRPEISAQWKPQASAKDWESAHWYFSEKKGKSGIWLNKRKASENWEIEYQFKNTALQFKLKLTAFKHIGIFPEQAENWKYIQQRLHEIKGESKVLNLFAYTGAASIVSATQAGQVANVDSVKQVINWGRENAQLNGLDNIRWILEDARKFVEKSIRRGDTYQGIIMDPPAFGYGAKREKWKLEADLKSLLEHSVQLLNPGQHFFILNTYSPKLPMDKLKVILGEIHRFPSTYEAKTLGLKSNHGRELPLGNLIRFYK